MKHALLSENEQLSTHLHGDDVKPTEFLQRQSLIEFMRCLGYNFADDWFTQNEYFFSNHPKNKGRNNISVQTAVKLHNGELIDTHGKRFREPFDFDEYSFVRAQAAKIVKICKLQYSKKDHRFVVQSHKVQFVRPSYYHIFMEN